MTSAPRRVIRLALAVVAGLVIRVLESTKVMSPLDACLAVQFFEDGLWQREAKNTRELDS